MQVTKPKTTTDKAKVAVFNAQQRGTQEAPKRSYAPHRVIKNRGGLSAPTISDVPRDLGPSGRATAQRMARLPGTPPDKLPTKAAAHLTLCAMARQFANHQNSQTFERLSEAVAMARLLNLY